MVLLPSAESKKKIDNVNEITFEEMTDYIYFNPIGIVDTIRTKTGLKILPFTLNDEIDKKINDQYTYNVRIFYMGFTDAFTTSKKLLKITDLKNAIKIAQDDEILECKPDVKRYIIRSSDFLSQKFKRDLSWYAFWGFKKYLPLSRHNKN